jgi:CRP-like cAMP-binding protein
VSQALESDIAEVERILARTDRSIRDRLLDAFGRWAGRYIGPMAKDIASVIEDNPELLGNMVKTFPQRFAKLITDAIATSATKLDRKVAHALTQTIISTSIGLKYQINSRDAYLERLATALDLLRETFETKRLGL